VTQHNTGFAAWAARPEPAGATLAELFPGDPGMGALWDEVRGGGPHAEHHVERRGPDGVRSFWSVRARRVEEGVLVAAADVSSMAAAAHALHGAQRTFVSAAAHELRAPLSAIKAWASALAARRRGEEAFDDGLSVIARQVDRMHLLLSDLLEAARSDAGALRAVPTPVALGELLPPGTPATSGPDDRVRVDPPQIAAALARLVAWVTARRPEAPAVISAEREGDEVHVILADPGPPLSAAAEAMLFARAGAGRTRGAGLGLHIVQLLAAASGGRVFREGGPEGARFVLAVPAADAPQPARAPGPLRVAVAVRASSGLGARAATLLRLYGHLVETLPAATSIREDTDLVLADADHLLGGVAALRARPAPPLVLALAPAGRRPEALAHAEREGALAVLPEPIDWGHLLALVETAAAALGAG
jgi:nitrogen-specific signal transduction histidine kinase